MDGFIKVIEYVSKIIGFIGLLGGAISFSAGNKMLSAISVFIAYVGFIYWLASIALSKKKVVSPVAFQGSVKNKKTYVYKKYQRIASWVGILFISMSFGFWVHMLFPVKSRIVPKQPPIVISPSESNRLSSPNESNSFFTAEKLEIDAYFYGISKGNKTIWEINAIDSKFINTTVGRRLIDQEPTTLLKALFMTNTPVVINNLFLVVKSISAPVKIQEMQVFSRNPIGGGGPIDNIIFMDARIGGTNKKIPLEPNPDINLPYSLGANEAVVISVPITPVKNGLFSFYLLADILDYKGNPMEIESKTLTYGYLLLPSDEIASQPISILGH